MPVCVVQIVLADGQITLDHIQRGIAQHFLQGVDVGIVARFEKSGCIFIELTFLGNTILIVIRGHDKKGR